MSDNNQFMNPPIKLRPRIIMQAKPAEAVSMPVLNAVGRTASFDDLIASGHIKYVSFSVDPIRKKYYAVVSLDNNSEYTLTGEGNNSAEAMADLKMKIIDFGFVL